MQKKKKRKEKKKKKRRKGYPKDPFIKKEMAAKSILLTTQHIKQQGHLY